VGYSSVHRLILDEAARIPDSTYYALRPMLARSKGTILAISTPFGRRGWFYEAWEDTNADEHAMDVAAVERLLADLDFPIEEYSAPGLGAPRDAEDELRAYQWTKIFSPVTHGSRLSRAYIANERRSIPDLWFRQEWLCEFVELGNVVFRYEDLMAAASQRKPFFDASGEFHDSEPVVGTKQGFALGNGVWGH
jgi:hypothetical protein